VSADHPEELTAAILSLLRDDARRKAMGERGAQVARERFNMAASVSAVQRLYAQVLNAGRVRE
jgi:glycosyltransferase involved in cell wall biosynthesis